MLFDFSGNEIDDKTIQAIAPSLQGEFEMDEFKIAFNRLTWGGVNPIVGFLLDDKRKLAVLNLSYNKLGADVDDFCKQLSMNNHLHHLNLSGNPLGNEAIKKLLQCLLEKSTLKILSINNVQIGDEVAEVLAYFIMRNRNLKELHLSANRFSERGLTILLNAFRLNNTLNKVSIDGNVKAKEITDIEARNRYLKEKIAPILTKNSAVNSLYTLSLWSILNSEKESQKFKDRLPLEVQDDLARIIDSQREFHTRPKN